MTMLAYHGDPELKRGLLRQLAAHKRADAVLQRTYGRVQDGKWRGCAVACSLRSLHKLRGDFDAGREDYGDHAELARLVGVPEPLLYLEDRLFEGMETELAREWPQRFARATKPGSDLSLVWPRFAIAILSDPSRGCARHASPAGKAAIATVVALLERRIAGDEPSADEWHAAASAAARAAASAAARAAAAAARAAEAAAAEAAAAWAAEAAEAAAAEAAATAEAHYSWMSDVLVSLLEEA